jgi:hypothetical protein
MNKLPAGYKVDVTSLESFVVERLAEATAGGKFREARRAPASVLTLSPVHNGAVAIFFIQRAVSEATPTSLVERAAGMSNNSAV